MRAWLLFLRPRDSPIQALITLFILWKSSLLLIAACSPGPGYDTSTTLAQPHDLASNHSPLVLLLRLVSTKLTRWDAIYFTKTASRGYLFEQEWAFGWGFTQLIGFFAQDLRDIGFTDYEFLESFVGITVAHTAHGLSVLVLHSLTRAVLPEAYDQQLPFVTAALHIFSPAGIFLSAPYGESTYALLSFCGYLFFVQSFGTEKQDTPAKDMLILVSGVLLGTATTVRNNGLLNGFLFLEEAIRIAYSIRYGLSIFQLRRLVATIIGGACIAMGFLIPQYIAFREYCMDSSISGGQPPRVWCERMLPSIYTFVQGYYWNVGFLRYWTLSNLPLFALAIPMLAIMSISSLWAMDAGLSNVATNLLGFNTELLGRDRRRSDMSRRLLRSLAVPQFLLAALAFTSYHVQIITRISSGYCIWYFWLAALLTETTESRAFKGTGATKYNHNGSTRIVRYMVFYAAIQAGLFASFLPPA